MGNLGRVFLISESIFSPLSHSSRFINIEDSIKSISKLSMSREKKSMRGEVKIKRNRGEKHLIKWKNHTGKKKRRNLAILDVCSIKSNHEIGIYIEYYEWNGGMECNMVSRESQTKKKREKKPCGSVTVFLNCIFPSSKIFLKKMKQLRN